MQTGLESMGLTGAQHETNVTASVRHCCFINGRTGARTAAPTRLELAAVQAWQQGDARGRDFTPPAPRGDLRGDIASNARMRPESPPREDAVRRR
jgi:hypothetical protein